MAITMSSKESALHGYLSSIMADQTKRKRKVDIEKDCVIASGEVSISPPLLHGPSS